MSPDRHNDRPERTDRPTMDPTRSADIRALLVRTVAAAPRPRTARLSRAAFSLAATAALLFAGGIGAGAVVAYDRLAVSVLAQDSGSPEAVNEQGGEFFGQSADNTDAAADSDPGGTESAADELRPVLELNGEIGYAYRSDLLTVQFVSGATLDTAEPATGTARVPIYQADGVTVLGYFDPAGLLP